MNQQKKKGLEFKIKVYTFISMLYVQSFDINKTIVGLVLLIAVPYSSSFLTKTTDDSKLQTNKDAIK